VWINVGDIILVSLRDYQDEKCDIIHKYTPDEARTLKKKGEVGCASLRTRARIQFLCASMNMPREVYV
jgi:Translation initiation factor 1A / IF-1